MNKIYKTFLISNKFTDGLAKDLENKLNLLIQYNWHIERIDCVDNTHGEWDSEGMNYINTKDYIILASTEENGYEEKRTYEDDVCNNKTKKLPTKEIIKRLRNRLHISREELGFENDI